MRSSPVFVPERVGFWLWRNPKFSTNCTTPVNGGDSACPPEPPLRLAIMLYYLLWRHRSRRMPHRGCNIFHISLFSMNPAAPDGAPPRRISD